MYSSVCMKRYGYLLGILFVVSLVGGRIFTSDSPWLGTAFYLVMFSAFIIIIGHWLLNIK